MNLSNMPSALSLFLLSSIAIVLSYSNSFNASWHLDDEPNILNNSKLHVAKLDLRHLANAMRANPTAPESSSLYRPVPCLSFGLNWYFGQKDVFGYHLVNLAIHVLTSWFLFLSVQLVLHSWLGGRESPQFCTVAALACSLCWALAPIQTQAVTYIVQRMAAMAALFSIIAIYAYLRGRTSTDKKQVCWFLLSLLSFLAALGSKENAILLPPSLLLLEISFFRSHLSKKQVERLVLAGVLALALGFLFVRYGLGIVPFSLSNPLSFLDSYSNRSFSFLQRLLSQPRIVLMYLSQIFLPSAERLSIEHELTLSTSLLVPWTTLPAIAVVALMICSAMFFLKKHPLVFFPVLFFFLNHAVESTILQLEPVFEHRNYLPSFFLFLPMGILLAKILHGSRPQPLFRRLAAISVTILFLSLSGHATYARNLAWTSEGSLWADVIRKAPNSARAAHNLGCWHRQLGRYRLAYRYFQQAVQNSAKAADPKMTKRLALNGLASVVYMTGQYEQSLHYFSQCLEMDAKDEACLKNRMLAYLQLGQPELALPDAARLVQEYPQPMEYQYLAAVAAYQVGQDDQALGRIGKIVGRSLDNHKVLHLAGLLMKKKGAYPNSLFFLKQADRLLPDTLDYQLALASVYYEENTQVLAEKMLATIFRRHPLPSIKSALSVQKNDLGKGAAQFVASRIDAMIADSSMH